MIDGNRSMDGFQLEKLIEYMKNYKLCLIYSSIRAKSNKQYQYLGEMEVILILDILAKEVIELYAIIINIIRDKLHFNLEEKS